MGRINLNALWVSVRPKTLSASLSPIALACALAEWPPHLPSLSLVVAAALLMQMGVNLANDYYDVQKGVDQDRVGPLRSLQLGEISASDLKVIFVSCFALAFTLGVVLSWFRGIELFILGLICLAVAYCYAGGRWPLSHYMLGEVLAFVFFGPVPVLGTLWALQGSFGVRDVFFSLLPGFISALMMGLNNQRDVHTDRAARKWTWASVGGEGVARVCNLFFLAMTVVLPLLYYKIFDLSLWIFLVLAAFLIFIRQWMSLLNGARGRELTAILEATGKYFVFYHLCLVLGVCIS